MSVCVSSCRFSCFPRPLSSPRLAEVLSPASTARDSQNSQLTSWRKNCGLCPRSLCRSTCSVTAVYRSSCLIVPAHSKTYKIARDSQAAPVTLSLVIDELTLIESYWSVHLWVLNLQFVQSYLPKFSLLSLELCWARSLNPYRCSFNDLGAHCCCLRVSCAWSSRQPCRLSWLQTKDHDDHDS